MTSCTSSPIKMVIEESRLNIAHQNLKVVPKSLINSFHSRVTIIDLSNNNISDISFLKSFTCLTCIILDHNYITSSAVFPYLPQVTVLWLNNNHIQITQAFIKHLHDSFPSLRQLSLMGNPGVPLCHEESYYEYLRYRLYIISCFGSLEHLDDRPVTSHEKEEAERLFGSPIIEKLNVITDLVQDAVNKVRQYITTPATNRPSVI